MNLNNDEEEEIKEIEINDKQADFLEAIMYTLTYQGVKKAIMIGGIGSGKSVILGNAIKIISQELPRGKAQFACNAVKQAKRALTPGLKSTWREFWNAVEYDPTTGEGEFVLWKKPPAHWKKPFEEPDDWDNCISWDTGHVVEFCGYSQDQDAHRGRNDDILLIDEASRFKRDWLKVAEGRVRANLGKFDSSLHHLCLYFSNPNYDSEGDWMWDLEQLAIAQPDRYAFVHTCTLDNVAFLPKGYIEDKKKTMHDLEYRVEVLGERVTRIKNSYYSALKWSHHSDVDLDDYYSPTQELTASVDLNVLFTCSTIWQANGPEHTCIANPFVKEAKEGYSMAESLGFEIDAKFKSHIKKTIIITGDRNGSNTTAGSKKKANGQYETQFDQLTDTLEALGWTVILAPLNYNPPKNEVHTFMQDVLLENDREEFHLRFHPEHAKQTLISMTFTPIKDDYNKDKKSERRKSVEQENATHLSDTVDYYALYVKHDAYVYRDGGFDMEFF